MDANDLEKYACRRPCTFVPTTPTSPHSTRILVPLCGPHRLGKIGSAYPYALQSPGPRVIKQIPHQAHWHVRSNFPFVGKLVIFPALIAVSSFLFVPVQPLHRDNGGLPKPLRNERRVCRLISFQPSFCISLSSVHHFRSLKKSSLGKLQTAPALKRQPARRATFVEVSVALTCCTDLPLPTSALRSNHVLHPAHLRVAGCMMGSKTRDVSLCP
ncbi:hypothetical protein C8R46DRAFT_1213966 [Mycena filopes]|nr:hypothetical protein C8R46DRAFT_1213966 [Mycena filopes]